MKLAIIGDFHIRQTRPRYRTEEDFLEVCMGKLRQVQQIAEDNGCFAILQPGDLFDSPTPGHLALRRFIEVRPEPSKIPFLTIHGQHDLSYHSEKSAKHAATAPLEAAIALDIVDGQGYTLPKHIKIVGADFGQAPPPAHEFIYNILLTHAPVGDRPLWPGHELTSPEAYVRKHPGYDLYVLGDYHYPFTVKVGEATLINAGCVVRQSADERTLRHRPKVVVFNTDDSSTKDIYLDAAPVEKAFDLSRKEADKPAEGPDFEEFVAELRKGGKVGVDFGDNLMALFEQRGVPQRIRDYVLMALNEKGEG